MYVCIFIYTCECNKFLFLMLFLNSSFCYILFPVYIYIRCKYPIKYIYKKRYGLYVYIYSVQNVILLIIKLLLCVGLGGVCLFYYIVTAPVQKSGWYIFY